MGIKHVPESFLLQKIDSYTTNGEEDGEGREGESKYQPNTNKDRDK